MGSRRIRRSRAGSRTSGGTIPDCRGKRARLRSRTDMTADVVVSETARTPLDFDPVPALAFALGLPAAGVAAVIALLDEGNTVPFIARYRKERTGGLDEVQIRAIEERRTYLIELEERRAAILASVGEQGKLTPELEAQAARRARPRPSSRTCTCRSGRAARPARPSRASAGLEPLAERSSRSRRRRSGRRSRGVRQPSRGRQRRRRARRRARHRRRAARGHRRGPRVRAQGVWPSTASS